MKNGFEITITEADFKLKEIPEQNWILFQRVTMIGKCLTEIENGGCNYGRTKYRAYWLKIFGAIASGVTVGLGFVYIIYKITCG